MRTQIIMPFFNPCGYKKPLRNIQDSLQASRHPIDVVELVYDGAMPEVVNYTGGNHYVVQADSCRHILWQKEALLNIAISRRDTEFVCVLDGDVMFKDKDWLEKTEDVLTTFQVAQPFCMCRSAPPWGQVIWPSFAATYQIRKNPTWHAKPGYALAFRRGVAPLVDCGFIGGGDLINLCVAVGNYNHGLMGQLNLSIREEIVKQGQRISMLTEGRLGVVPNELHYFEHGSHEDRQYNERYAIIKNVRPHIDIIKNSDGIWEWQTEGLNDACLRFFEGRNEDA